ncbi:CCR4-NOT transcription complex subunit 9 isoform X2 [Medicago truncatula]|uniref:CCR4-NOT transcription complex subunit 9 isoform X2 n=1 Tax=Medicago truncatula TaxID=3880 RepID=UPI00196872AF|nr:CCR4-NOT transcription complex subunit 9 isoform X2 [Medicago truncatula]
MENFPPQSPSLKNNEFLHVASVSNTIGNKMLYAECLVIELSNPDLRENALHLLSKMTDLFRDLAPLLWNSIGTIAIFLQCVASHPDTKLSFMKANIPIYLYPFLNTSNKLAPFEDLRLASLGVIAAMVKVKTKEAIGFLLATEVMPLCLRNMEIGKELSKTVATFIVEKILSDDDGLAYICGTPDRFFAVGRALDRMLASVDNQPSPRLLKLMIPCYTSLTKNVGFFKPNPTPPS